MYGMESVELCLPLRNINSGIGDSKSFKSLHGISDNKSSTHQAEKSRMVLSSGEERCAAVSLKMEALVTGSGFNVASDQISHFKHIICVENDGYNSGNIEIRDGSEHFKTSTESQSRQNLMCLEVFPVRCKTTNAGLYRSKLGSGGRGRCILYKEQWFTPSEFENFCGRGSSKDWKRSIKYEGKSLQSLIDDEVLTPHATNCSCYICSEDVSGSEHIRLFTPYKRRKRNIADEEHTSKKRPADICASSRNFSSNTDAGNPAANVDTSPDLVTQTSLGLHFNQQILKSLETVYSTMVKATSDFKRIIVELQNSYSKTVELLSKEKNLQLNSRIRTTDIEQNASGNLLSNELLTAKKCANCNREALAECSLCRRTPYCSTFCQRKDWNSHQVECARNPLESAEQIMLLVDDQT